MKLAFCLFKYFPYGGLQRDFVRIASACHARGHEIHVYTASMQGELPANFIVHTLKVDGWQNHTRNAAFAKAAISAIQKESFDLTIGFNKMPGLDVYYAADICQAAKIHQSRPPFYRLLPRYRAQIAMEEAVFARGNKTQILLIAEQQRIEFMRFYGTEPERFNLLPPGIQKDRLAPANASSIRQDKRRELGLTSDAMVLLMVGSGFKTKGLDRAIKALTALPESARLLVVGQDNAEPFIKLAEECKVSSRVRFLGGRDDVSSLLLAADILVHPAYHENTGTVLLEAACAGLPVVTVDQCGYAHYLKTAKAGIVLPAPFSTSDFNAALVQLFDAKQRAVYQENAHRFAKTADIYSLPERAADVIEREANNALRLRNRSFTDWMTVQGESYRLQPGRHTQRIQEGNKTYYIKQHFGIGWQEIAKNLLQGRLPVLGAKNEYKALQALQNLGVKAPKVLAFDQCGFNPAYKQSFIALEELAPMISLEELIAKGPLDVSLKRQLINRVAKIAQTLHRSGINHRDFYLCHFLLDLRNSKEINLYLIDLHRAQCRARTPRRWLIKDLAGLYFSSKDAGLTKRDWYRFMRAYRNKQLRFILKTEAALWIDVQQRGEKLYHEHNT